MTYGTGDDAALGLAELANGRVFSAGGNCNFAEQFGISTAAASISSARPGGMTPRA